MVLKTEKCSFSGLRVYPGHGMRLTKQDSSTFLYLNGKCKKLAAQKKKQRDLVETIRQKQLEEAASKKDAGKKDAGKAIKATSTRPKD